MEAHSPTSTDCLPFPALYKLWVVREIGAWSSWLIRRKLKDAQVWSRLNSMASVKHCEIHSLEMNLICYLAGPGHHYSFYQPSLAFPSFPIQLRSYSLSLQPPSYQYPCPSVPPIQLLAKHQIQMNPIITHLLWLLSTAGNPHRLVSL